MLRVGYDTTQTPVVYTWEVETVAAEDHGPYRVGDVADYEGAADYADAVQVAALDTPPHCARLIVLVRDSWKQGRSWAYVRDGVIDAYCRDASGNPVTRTPRVYVREVQKVAR